MKKLTDLTTLAEKFDINQKTLYRNLRQIQNKYKNSLVIQFDNNSKVYIDEDLLQNLMPELYTDETNKEARIQQLEKKVDKILNVLAEMGEVELLDE